jgi:Ion transport protein
MGPQLGRTRSSTTSATHPTLAATTVATSVAASFEVDDAPSSKHNATKGTTQKGAARMTTSVKEGREASATSATSAPHYLGTEQEGCATVPPVDEAEVIEVVTNRSRAAASASETEKQRKYYSSEGEVLRERPFESKHVSQGPAGEEAGEGSNSSPQDYDDGPVREYTRDPPLRRNPTSSGSKLQRGQKNAKHAWDCFQHCRIMAGKFVNSDHVQTIVVALIAVNAIMMGVGTFPFVNDNPSVNAAFDTVDTVFLIIFTVELGAQFCYRGYRLLTDGWLVFDLIVILMSWCFASVQIIRSFRIFRALRLITRIKVMKNLVLGT